MTSKFRLVTSKIGRVTGHLGRVTSNSERVKDPPTHPSSLRTRRPFLHRHHCHPSSSTLPHSRTSMVRLRPFQVKVIGNGGSAVVGRRRAHEPDLAPNAVWVASCRGGLDIPSSWSRSTHAEVERDQVDPMRLSRDGCYSAIVELRECF